MLSERSEACLFGNRAALTTLTPAKFPAGARRQLPHFSLNFLFDIPNRRRYAKIPTNNQPREENMARAKKAESAQEAEDVTQPQADSPPADAPDSTAAPEPGKPKW